MSTSSPNKLRTRLAEAIAGLCMVSVIVLALSDLMAQKPAIKEQATSKATPKPKPKATPNPELTGTPTSTESPGPNCIWPPADDLDKCRVIKAFVKALQDSTKDKPFRDKLLTCTGLNCTTPTKEVQRILDDEIGNPNGVKIPMVMFYFDPNAPSGSTIECPAVAVRQDCPRPDSFCYTILSLPSYDNPPPEPYWKDLVRVFKYHTRCCYQPWSPQGVCTW